MKKLYNVESAKPIDKYGNVSYETFYNLEDAQSYKDEANWVEAWKIDVYVDEKEYLKIKSAHAELLEGLKQIRSRLVKYVANNAITYEGDIFVESYSIADQLVKAIDKTEGK